MTQEQNNQEQTKERAVFRFSQKQGFFLGLGAGIALLSIIGFFILLAPFLRNNENSALSRADANPLPRAAVPAASELALSAPGDSGNITLSPITDKDWVRGNRKAEISIIEFSDTECPFCKRFHPTMQQVLAIYGDRVNWVYRHFPLTPLHPKAPKEAEALECAGELGGNNGFWKYTDRLFEVTPSNNGLDLEELPKIAAYVGLSQTKFQSCLDSGKYAQKVSDHANWAIAAGCSGTPCSIVVAQNQKIPVSGAVPLEQLRAIIDPLLN